MLKNISKLEIKIGEKTYQFLCDMDSSLQDVKEAIFQFQKYIGHVEDHVKQQIADKEEKESKVTPIVEDIQTSVQA